MSATDEEFEGLLRAVRRADRPSAADRDAVRRALAGALAASAMAPGIAGAAKAGIVFGKGSALMNVLVPLVAGATLGAGVTATAFVVSDTGEIGREQNKVAVVAPAAASAKATAPPVEPVALGTPVAVAEPESEAHPASPAPVSAKSEPTAPRVDPLELESRGIAEVQRALRDGQAVRALGLLDAEDRAHPRGVLVEERAAARVFALCSLGRTSEAQRSAAEFARRFPKSLLGERVRSRCAGR